MFGKWFLNISNFYQWNFSMQTLHRISSWTKFQAPVGGEVSGRATNWPAGPTPFFAQSGWFKDYPIEQNIHHNNSDSWDISLYSTLSIYRTIPFHYNSDYNENIQNIPHWVPWLSHWNFHESFSGLSQPEKRLYISTKEELPTNLRNGKIRGTSGPQIWGFTGIFPGFAWHVHDEIWPILTNHIQFRNSGCVWKPFFFEKVRSSSIIQRWRGTEAMLSS